LELGGAPSKRGGAREGEDKLYTEKKKRETNSWEGGVNRGGFAVKYEGRGGTDKGKKKGVKSSKMGKI